jgi:7-cyano-7-deazaguanine reductase
MKFDPSEVTIINRTPGDRPEEDRNYGTRSIEKREIEVWDNPHPDLDIYVFESFPEFTCLCPRSGYPDFATVVIESIPDLLVVELKALKLYLNSYRDYRISHEAVCGKILKDIKKWIDPRYLKVTMLNHPRGNLTTYPSCVYRKDLFKDIKVEELRNDYLSGLRG